ncbi:MAG TPA: acyl carrier protein [Polyangiaceae bacterium]|nr:acyl carrier protein [Polyangiaceae bacterium]
MTVREQVREFITTNFYVPDPNVIEDTTSFLDGGIIDSTGVLEVVTFIESEFGISVEDTEMLPENLDSVGNIVAYVERKRA